MSLPVLRWAGAITVVLALMAGSALAAWRWQTNRYDRQLAEQARSHQSDLTTISNAGAAQARRALEKQQSAEQALADIDEVHTKERAHDLAENESLRRAVADRDRRLHIAGSCRAGGGDMPGTAGTTGMGHAGTVELTAVAGRTVFDIRAGIIADQTALKALQAYVREACR